MQPFFIKKFSQILGLLSLIIGMVIFTFIVIQFRYYQETRSFILDTVGDVTYKKIKKKQVLKSFPDTLQAVQVFGEKLFKNNCASCHNTNESKLVGPGLAGILKRRDPEWLKLFIKNSQAVIANGDEYAVTLYQEYDSAQMQSFPEFSDAELEAMLFYLGTSYEDDYLDSLLQPNYDSIIQLKEREDTIKLVKND